MNLKAAQQEWASRKYFVMLHSQQEYQAIRRLFSNNQWRERKAMEFAERLIRVQGFRPMRQIRLWGRWEGINHIETETAYVSHDTLLFSLNTIRISSLVYTLDERLVLSHTVKMHLDWMHALVQKNIYTIASNKIKTYDSGHHSDGLVPRYQAFSVVRPLFIITCNELLFSARFGLGKGHHLLFYREPGTPCEQSQ